MSRWRFPIVLAACALACSVVAIINRHEYPPGYPQPDTKSFGPGFTAFAPLDPPPSRFDSFNLWDPYLWAGAATALLIVAIALVAHSSLQHRASQK